MSIPEDIDEQLSMSSFHSGSAKVRYFRSNLEFRVKSEGWHKLLEKCNHRVSFRRAKQVYF